jgi:superfamily II DNA/RNA helicase
MDLDRPEIQLITRSTDMTSTHRKIYSQVEKGFFVENVDTDVNAANYALSQSQIAVNTPEYFDPTGSFLVDIGAVESQADHDRIVKESSKLTLLKDLLENELEDEPVIIYSSFARTIQSLHKHLDKYKPVMIHGQTQGPSRELARAKFQEGKTNIILITDAGGEALNLQRAGHVIFYSLPWTPGAYIQIIGRARRFGSARKFLGVWHLTVKDSVDELVSAALNSKVSGFETILKTPDLIPVSTDSLSLEVARAMRQRRIKF